MTCNGGRMNRATNTWRVAIVCCVVTSLLACGSDTKDPATNSTTDSAGGGTDGGSNDAGTTGNTDAGGVDAGGGCGAITELGACDGTKLSWCNAQKKVDSEDCKDYFGTSQAGVCVEIDKTQGHFCAAKTGDECLFEDDDGELTVEYCGGAKPGCVELPTGATCTENVGVCTDDDKNTCKGDLAIWHCNTPQPAATNCAAFGGKCTEENGEAICTGVPKGRECDPDYGINCAAGLTCTGASNENWGTCE